MVGRLGRQTILWNISSAPHTVPVHVDWIDTAKLAFSRANKSELKPESASGSESISSVDLRRQRGPPSHSSNFGTFRQTAIEIWKRYGHMLKTRWIPSIPISNFITNRLLNPHHVSAQLFHSPLSFHERVISDPQLGTDFYWHGFAPFGFIRRDGGREERDNYSAQ